MSYDEGCHIIFFIIADYGCDMWFNLFSTQVCHLGNLNAIPNEQGYILVSVYFTEITLFLMISDIVFIMGGHTVDMNHFVQTILKYILFLVSSS